MGFCLLKAPSLLCLKAFPQHGFRLFAVGPQVSAEPFKPWIVWEVESTKHQPVRVDILLEKKIGGDVFNVHFLIGFCMSFYGLWLSPCELGVSSFSCGSHRPLDIGYNSAVS